MNQLKLFHYQNDEIFVIIFFELVHENFNLPFIFSINCMRYIRERLIDIKIKIKYIYINRQTFQATNPITSRKSI